MNRPSALQTLRGWITRMRGQLATLEAAVPVVEEAERLGLMPDLVSVEDGVLPLPEPHTPTRRRRRIVRRRRAAAAPRQSGRPTRQPRAVASLDRAGLERDVIGVLTRVRKPLRAGEVCDQIPGADSDEVVAVLRDLARRRVLEKTGATVSLRYAMPEFATVLPAAG